LLTQLIIAMEIGYLNQKHFEIVRNECQMISGMLGRLIAVRSKSIT